MGLFVRSSAWFLAVGALCVGSVGCGADREDGRKSATRRIAFARDFHLHVMDASGGDERELEGANYYFSWSPDGDQVAYASAEDGLVVADARTGTTDWQTGRPCFKPTWSPRGDLIACENEEPYEITMVNTRTHTSRKITPDCCRQPTWSPDGQQIAVWS